MQSSIINYYVHFEYVDDGIATGILAHLRHIYPLGCGIIGCAANIVHVRAPLKGKVEVPDCIGFYVPRMLLSVLDRTEIVRIVSPDLVLIGVCMTAFITARRVIA